MSEEWRMRTDRADDLNWWEIGHLCRGAAHASVVGMIDDGWEIEDFTQLQPLGRKIKLEHALSELLMFQSTWTGISAILN
jgi:hypothetical protein